MSDKTYNGWSNYETWNVALWLDNEQGSCNYWNERAQDVYNDAEASSYQTRDEAATNDLAAELKDQIEEASQNMLEATGQGASMFADLLGAAISEVNWYEIASHYIDEVDKQDSREPEELQVGD